MKDIPLHDIKPLMEVPDNSFMTLLIIATAILLIVLLALGLWGWKSYQKNKKLNLRKLYLDKIHSIDTTNAKQAAYEISEYGRLLAVSDKEKNLLENLDQRLSQYKYKKEVGKIDDDTLSYYHVFLEVLDAT